MKKFVVPKKKFTMPTVGPEAMESPEVVAMLAIAQHAVDEANAILEKIWLRDKEIARLKKNKKSAPRHPR